MWPDIPEGRVESIVFHLHPAAESELTHPPRAKSVQLEPCSTYMYSHVPGESLVNYIFSEQFVYSYSNS